MCHLEDRNMSFERVKSDTVGLVTLGDSRQLIIIF
jgi:hypothetical protein